MALELELLRISHLPFIAVYVTQDGPGLATFIVECQAAMLALVLLTIGIQVESHGRSGVLRRLLGDRSASNIDVIAIGLVLAHAETLRNQELPLILVAVAKAMLCSKAVCI